MTLQKKNVESGTVQEQMDMMKKCKLCFLCTIIDLPMKDIFLFSPSAANVSIFSLDALVMRFEAPESRNRWDSPLFVIQVNIIVWSQVAQHYPHDKKAAKIKVWVDLHLSIMRLSLFRAIFLGAVHDIMLQVKIKIRSKFFNLC